MYKRWGSRGGLGQNQKNTPWKATMKIYNFMKEYWVDGFNQREVAQLAKYPTHHNAEKSCVRHLPSLDTSRSFTRCVWIRELAFAPKDWFSAIWNQASLRLRVKGIWVGLDERYIGLYKKMWEFLKTPINNRELFEISGGSYAPEGRAGLPKWKPASNLTHVRMYKSIPSHA